jgi:hypothetical protein
MFRLPKSVLAVGGAALATVLLILAAPRTVHAVAAALVQVTNTSSNPVVTQSTNQQATQLIELTCNMTALGKTGGSGICNLLSPTNGQSGFVVPANQSLVVTTVDIAPNNFEGFCAGGMYGESIQVNGSGIVSYSRMWIVSYSGAGEFGPTTHFTYPTGIVFAPNSALTVTEDTGCAANFVLTGYLTNS